jgi:hypothetical protein
MDINEPDIYMRKPILVKVWQVDNNNIAALAEKCKGAIKGKDGGKYIFLNFPKLQGEQNERYKRAYIGDYVVALNDRHFRFYTEDALKSSYDSVNITLNHTHQLVEKLGSLFKD